MYNDVYFLMRKSFEFFSLNGCNSTIASNKQRQGHNNLTTVWRLERKTRGIPRALEEPPTCPRTQMQIKPSQEWTKDSLRTIII